MASLARLTRPAAMAASAVRAAARRVVARQASTAAKPLAAPAKRVQRGASLSVSTTAFFGTKQAETADAEIYGLSVKGIDGNKIPLSKYKGKVLLIVNVASACGFTPQYTGLEELRAEFGSRGLEVLLFPCNQFGSQEPGSDSNIKGFARDKGFKGVMLAKGDVNGPNTDPLFDLLKKKQGGLLTSDIKWNFTKFLVDREGNVVGRYASTATPESLKKDIEKYL